MYTYPCEYASECGCGNVGTCLKCVQVRVHVSVWTHVRVCVCQHECLSVDEAECEWVFFLRYPSTCPDQQLWAHRNTFPSLQGSRRRGHGLLSSPASVSSSVSLHPAPTGMASLWSSLVPARWHAALPTHLFRGTVQRPEACWDRRPKPPAQWTGIRRAQPASQYLENRCLPWWNQMQQKPLPQGTGARRGPRGLLSIKYLLFSPAHTTLSNLCLAEASCNYISQSKSPTCSYKMQTN